MCMFSVYTHSKWYICCMYIFVHIYCLGAWNIEILCGTQEPGKLFIILFPAWQNRTNYNLWVMNIMKKSQSAPYISFLRQFDDFISFIHLFLAFFFHELVCYFDRAIPWVIQSRNSFHLFDILFSLRNDPYRICISFPWMRWYIW